MELVCLNHSPVAIATHTLNHPEARHYVQDIATVRPHLIVPEGYLDLLMASPTCTHHSNARGGKPTSDQQRSDPWHIITWLTELRVKRLIIENVWEFVGWGPVDVRTGRPIASRKGEYFHAWIETIKRLGFEPEWRKLNAADYGDATTRQRFILMARSDGRKVSWPMPTHRKRNDAVVDLFDAAKPWRPAREIIDWKIKGRSIFGRKKDLAPKTLARIHAGAVKFGWPEPFLVILRNHMAGQSLGDPMPTAPTGGAHALISPYYGSGSGETCNSADETLPTITSKGRFGLIVPVTHHDGLDRVRDTNVEPLPTITGANRGELAFITAQQGERHGQAPRVHSVDDPTPTIAATGHVDLVDLVTDIDGYDILFRMLEPHELAAAMGFNTDDQEYEFAGTKTEKIKQIGNAVSVRKMQACVAAIMADAAPKAIKQPDEADEVAA
jgi:DNA (cytosine-5)-methyltransferase 1